MGISLTASHNNTKKAGELLFLSQVTMLITRNGNDLWLSYWVSNLDPHHHHHRGPHLHPHPSSNPVPTHPMDTPDLWSTTNSSQMQMQQSPYYSDTLCPTTRVSENQYTGTASLVGCHRELHLAFGSPHQHANVSWLHDSSSAAAASRLSHALPILRQLLEVAAGPRSGLDPDTKYYLSVLLCIAAANSVFTFVRAFSFAYGGLVAARKLHDQLLTAVIHAPAKFFQVTLPGRVLNRFSSDTSTADDALPFTLNILLANLFGLVGTILVWCLSDPYLLLALIPLAILYKYLQTYYRHTARELRRLNSIARSPVYATFTEALDGAASIRAYDAQQRFCQLNEHQVALAQQAAYAGIAAAQWLALRLQTIAAFVISLVALLAVLGHEALLPFAVSDGKFAASLVGLSLAYALPITDRLNGLLTVSAETEQEMVAVERLAEYTHLPPQPPTLHPHRAVPEQELALPFQRQQASLGQGAWPHQGHLQFCGVSLRYGQGLPDALDGVSFELRPGQKVGICGRTGAGKSSLVAALMRLTETRAGAVLLDGRDCRTVHLQSLRRSVGVVPQTPFLFQGSIRENLDPLELHSDRDMMSLLKDVGLWDILAGLSLSRSKAASHPIPALIPYSPSAASSVPTGTPPRSPLVRPGSAHRLAPKPPLHSSSTPGSLTLSTLSATAEEDQRLLENAASPHNSTALLPNAAFVTSQGHTRVLRVAPLSSQIGPPSFPTTSAALEEEEPQPQPLILSRAPRGPQPPGGLSRSLSASASSSSGPTPSESTTQSADPEHISSAAPSAQLVTYSSLPPMSPAMAAALPEQHPPRQRSVKWPVAVSSKTADQLSASPGRPTLLQTTQVALGTSGEQVVHADAPVLPDNRQDPPVTPAGSPGSSRRGPSSMPQGIPTGQGPMRPSGQSSRRQPERRPVIERAPSDYSTQRQWPNFGGQLLSLQLGEGGVGLSQGQQQILCLARVLLEQPKVVCLDEATANVDPDTARLMQQVLRTHLRHSTVLQIAHRLDVIVECDWAVVMDKGKVVEQGSPQDLLEDQQSHFAALYQAAGNT